MRCVDFFFFKQKTAYEMRISDWSSDVVLFRSTAAHMGVKDASNDAAPINGNGAVESEANGDDKAPGQVPEQATEKEAVEPKGSAEQDASSASAAEPADRKSVV